MGHTTAVQRLVQVMCTRFAMVEQCNQRTSVVQCEGMGRDRYVEAKHDTGFT